MPWKAISKTEHAVVRMGTDTFLIFYLLIQTCHAGLGFLSFAADSVLE
jgi:hypothetical protein